MTRPGCIPLRLIAVLGFAGSVHAASSASDYPTRPIRMIMPNAPGSANDTIGRIMAAKLGDVLGQQIVVDNRAGAGGVVGMEIGKNAAPDGYTLVSPSTAATSIAPHIQKLPYDPLRDFAFISLFAATPNVLVVNPGLPVRSVREFIDYAKAQGGKLNMASAGSGAQSHLTGAALMAAAGFHSMHVPYKGGGPSVAAVVAGKSQWTITPSSAVMGLVRAGRLRALGHSLPKRTPLMGDLPSIAETLSNFRWSGWYGLTAPRATPQRILAKLHAALARAAALPEFKEQLALQGAEPATSTSEEFRRFVAQDIEETGKIVKLAGLKAE